MLMMLPLLDEYAAGACSLYRNLGMRLDGDTCRIRGNFLPHPELSAYTLTLCWRRAETQHPIFASHAEPNIAVLNLL